MRKWCPWLKQKIATKLGIARVMNDAERTVKTISKDRECVTYSLHHLFLSNAFVCTHVNATCSKNVGVKINWTLWSWIMVMNFIQSSLRMIYMTYATTGFWLFLVTEHPVNPCELWLYIWCLLWDGIIGIKILCINFFNNNNNFFKDLLWENPLAKGISWKSFLFHDKTKINI